MRFNTFIATTGESLTRATCLANGSWSVVTLLAGTQINCFATDSHNPHVVYAGTQGEGVLRSEDWGEAWHPAGMEGHIIKSLAVSAIERDVLYAGTGSPAVYLSRPPLSHAVKGASTSPSLPI